MKRRSYLATLGITALAGCSQLQSTSETEAEADSRWPSNATDSTPENTSRKWTGGYRDTDMDAGKLMLDNVTVEMVGADVAQQVGVSTSETDRENIENVPESEFEWFSASDNGFIWFVFLNFMRSDSGEIEVPNPDNWRALPIVEDVETPIKSFTSSYDPDPTYYRKPGYKGREYTTPAYMNLQKEISSQAMVFEVESNSIELLYGDPPQVTWYYEIE